MSQRQGERFGRVRRFRKGYHRRQVEAFLARAERSLQAATPELTAADIRRAGFELVRRGYQVEQVDAVLDEMELAAVRRTTAAGQLGRPDPAADVEFLCRELSAPYMQRFPRVRSFRRGYDIDDVDEFVDQVCAGLDRYRDSSQAVGAAADLSAVRTVAFRSRRGGYAEVAVDEVLDRVVGLMLLREAGERRSTEDVDSA